MESEARSLSSSALTCVFSHLYLQDASFNLSSFLTPVDSDSRGAAAAVVKSFVDAMLSKFLVVGPPTEAGRTGDTPDDEALLAGSGDAQVGGGAPTILLFPVCPVSCNMPWGGV